MYSPRRWVSGKQPPRRVTELGTERYCRGCDEWWPEDEEFFGITHRPDGWHTWCRACKNSRTTAMRRARNAA